MFTVTNWREYHFIKFSQKHNYFILASAKEQLLVIPRNIYIRAAIRQDKKLIRNPEVLTVDGVSLILTGNEWQKVRKCTARHDLIEVYRFEKKDRLKILKSQQKKRNLLSLNEANAAGCKKQFERF